MKSARDNQDILWSDKR